MINEVAEFEYYKDTNNFESLFERLVNYSKSPKSKNESEKKLEANAPFNHIAIILLRGYLFENGNNPWGSAPVIQGEDGTYSANTNITDAIEKVKNWFNVFFDFCVDKHKDKIGETTIEKVKSTIDGDPLECSYDKTNSMGYYVTEALKAGPLKAYTGFKYKKSDLTKLIKKVDNKNDKTVLKALCQLAYCKMMSSDNNQYVLLDEKHLLFTALKTSGNTNKGYSTVYKNFIEANSISVCSGGNYTKVKFSNGALGAIELLNDEFEDKNDNIFIDNEDYIVFKDNGINSYDEEDYKYLDLLK